MKNNPQSSEAAGRLAKRAEEFAELLLSQVSETSGRKLLSLGSEFGFEHTGVLLNPQDAGQSSIEFFTPGLRISFELFPAFRLDPLIVRQGLTLEKLSRTTQAGSCTWTDNKGTLTMNPGDTMPTDKDSGGGADDPGDQQGGTGSFDPGAVSFDSGSFAELVSRLPELTIPLEDDGRSPEVLFDWWEEMKKRFGGGAVFHAQMKPHPSFTFLLRGKADALIRVENGAEKPNFREHGDRPDLTTRYEFIQTDNEEVLLLPRGA